MYIVYFPPIFTWDAEYESTMCFSKGKSSSSGEGGSGPSKGKNGEVPSGFLGHLQAS